MTFSLTTLIVAYVVFVIIFTVFSLVGIYHLRRYGYAGDLTKPIILVYSILSTLIIIASFIAIFYEIYGGP